MGNGHVEGGQTGSTHYASTTHRNPGCNLGNQDSIQYWPKRALSLKKGHHSFYHPYTNSFFNVLHQNKALFNCHKRGQGLKAGCCFCVDWGLEICNHNNGLKLSHAI